MSNMLHNIKDKLSGDNSKSSNNTSSNNNNKEPTYSILPHPAKSNDPADLQPSGGLRHGGPMEAFHARDPYVPSEEIRNNMPAPRSREELHARQAQLQSENN
ncbi:hypothetical protein D9613_010621 [Agrocybe pediades]|uniref:Uncharacterized protein n=1 Tax=Agrocybe pediades TaxID=84607 RepID=A0A8H4QG47_9AGAR|nr:hypothetical protein D9613_010621 [Agrocybe pediades]KAF9553456.1 hypothetical protein CPC08DRAFT_645631 [Agrocybe pediades]